MRRRRRGRLATVLVLTASLLTLLFTFLRPTRTALSDSVVLSGEQQQQQRDTWSGSGRRLDDVRRGIRVVVGHYVGSGQDEPVKPLTKDLLDRNEYRPVAGEGELGEAVQLSPMQTSKMRQYYNVNKFNLLASDRISVNRSLPDVRKKECMSKSYDIDSLPSTSVVIVFHNEAWSTLLRTVHSVINRSPRPLLKEIILVDDASDRKFLKKELDAYAARLSSTAHVPPVHVLHLKARVGLIRARLRGAELAVGQVLTFLDAHCECTPGWLAPLLARVAQDRTKVVSPIIDVINDDTFAYVKSFEMHWGAINWEMHFRWFAVDQTTMTKRRQDITAPFKTPVMAGGLFAIDKDYFYELGTYDEQMDIWGGENLEISFRVWQCGGSLEIVPCSHVGHVFRKASPYSFPRPGGIASVLFRNLARVAQVWMDEWREFFFRLHPEAQSMRASLNVSDRVALRERLQCKSFKWYLDNVWPEHFFPMPGSFFGKIQNAKDGRCLRRPKNLNGGNQATGNAVMTNCSEPLPSPMLMLFTEKGFITSDESVCLDVPDPNMRAPSVFFLACTRSGRQRWKLDTEAQHIVHEQSGLCLDLPPTPTSPSLVLSSCQQQQVETSQQWIFLNFDWG